MRLIVHTACFQEWCTRMALMLNSKTPNCAREKNPPQLFCTDGCQKRRHQLRCSTTMQCTAQTKCYLPKNSNKITSEKKLKNIWKRKRGIWEIAHLSVISCKKKKEKRIKKKGTLRVDKLSSNTLMFIAPAGCRMVDCWSSQSQSNPWLCRMVLHIYTSFDSKFHSLQYALSRAYLRALVTSPLP